MHRHVRDQHEKKERAEDQDEDRDLEQGPVVQAARGNLGRLAAEQHPFHGEHDGNGHEPEQQPDEPRPIAQETEVAAPQSHAADLVSGRAPVQPPQPERRRLGFGGKVFPVDPAGGGDAAIPGEVEEPGEQQDAQRAQQLRRPDADTASRGQGFTHCGGIGRRHQPQRERKRRGDHHERGERGCQRQQRGAGPSGPQTQIDHGQERQGKPGRDHDRPVGTDAAGQCQLDDHGEGEAPGGGLKAGHEGRGEAIRRPVLRVVRRHASGKGGLHGGRRLAEQHEPAQHRQDHESRPGVVQPLLLVMVEDPVDAELDLAVVADLEQAASRLGRDGVTVRRHGVVRRPIDGRLVGIAERRDADRRRIVGNQAKAGRDDQIAGVFQHFRMHETRIEFGGEQHAIGERRTQRLRQDQLVVDVGADHADRHDPALAAAARGLLVLIELRLLRPSGALLDARHEAPHIVALVAAFGPFDFRLRLAIAAFLVAGARHQPLQLRRAVDGGAIEPPQVGVDFDGHAVIQPGLQRFREGAGIDRVPLAQEDDALVLAFAQSARAQLPDQEVDLAAIAADGADKEVLWPTGLAQLLRNRAQTVREGQGDAIFRPLRCSGRVHGGANTFAVCLRAPRPGTLPRLGEQLLGRCGRKRTDQLKPEQRLPVCEECRARVGARALRLVRDVREVDAEGIHQPVGIARSHDAQPRVADHQDPLTQQDRERAEPPFAHLRVVDPQHDRAPALVPHVGVQGLVANVERVARRAFTFPGFSRRPNR